MEQLLYGVWELFYKPKRSDYNMVLLINLIIEDNELGARSLFAQMFQAGEIGDINAKVMGHGGTLIELAADRGLQFLTTQLRAKGADPFQLDNRGDNALSRAVFQGHTKIIDLLLAPKQIFSLNEVAVPIIRAIEVSNATVAEKLLKKADPDDAKQILTHWAISESLPLQRAIDNGNLDLAALLVRYGADPFQTDQSGATMFQLAAQRDQKILEHMLNEIGLRSKELNEFIFLVLNRKYSAASKKIPSINWKKPLDTRYIDLIVSKIEQEFKFIPGQKKAQNTEYLDFLNTLVEQFSTQNFVAPLLKQSQLFLSLGKNLKERFAVLLYNLLSQENISIPDKAYQSLTAYKKLIIKHLKNLPDIKKILGLINAIDRNQNLGRLMWESRHWLVHTRLSAGKLQQAHKELMDSIKAKPSLLEEPTILFKLLTSGVLPEESLEKVLAATNQKTVSQLYSFIDSIQDNEEKINAFLNDTLKILFADILQLKIDDGFINSLLTNSKNESSKVPQQSAPQVTANPQVDQEPQPHKHKMISSSAPPTYPLLFTPLTSNVSEVSERTLYPALFDAQYYAVKKKVHFKVNDEEPLKTSSLPSHLEKPSATNQPDLLKGRTAASLSQPSTSKSGFFSKAPVDKSKLAEQSNTCLTTSALEDLNRLSEVLQDLPEPTIKLQEDRATEEPPTLHQRQAMLA